MSRAGPSSDLIVDDNSTIAGSIYEDDVVRARGVVDLSTLGGLLPFDGGSFETACTLSLAGRRGRGHRAVAV